MPRSNYFEKMDPKDPNYAVSNGFLAFIRSPEAEYNPHTCSNYASSLKNLIRLIQVFFPGKSVLDISSADMRTLLDRLFASDETPIRLQSRLRKKRWTNASIRPMIFGWTAFYAYCKIEGWLNENPVEGLLDYYSNLTASATSEKSAA